MRDTWVIAKREFLERVKSKWFVVMTVLWPVLMLGMMIVPALLGGQGTKGAKVEIVDHNGSLGQPMVVKLGAPPMFGGLEWDATIVPTTTTEDVLRDRLRTHAINGYLIIAEDALDGGEIIYSGDNASNQTVTIGLSQAVTAVVITARGKRAGLSEMALVDLVKPANVDVRYSTGEEKRGSAGIFVFLLGYMIAFLIYIVITLYGIGVMRSIVTEKSSRVVELLVSATKPRAMMSGKIVGVGTAGLVQIAIWFVLAQVALSQKARILHLFGASDDAKLAMMPSLSTSQLMIVMVFFLFGYLFYSAMYAAVGAMVSSEQDSQQAQMPVTFLLVIGMIAIMAVTNEPRGSVAKVMTMVPFWSPMLMPVRYFLGGASAADVGLSLAILGVSTVVVSRIAAKIYRVGILMYGKRPSLAELFRWIRY
ncbi:MAG TPA: ABC transporter permease [Kofleriaceae bacterium]|nr:ABC transporter permease [Kofleriaceae bacterium]